MKTLRCQMKAWQNLATHTTTTKQQLPNSKVPNRDVHKIKPCPDVNRRDQLRARCSAYDGGAGDMECKENHHKPDPKQEEVVIPARRRPNGEQGDVPRIGVPYRAVHFGRFQAAPPFGFNMLSNYQVSTPMFNGKGR